MTSPVTTITVKCPAYGNVYENWDAAYVNLILNDFDDEYPDACSSATCPGCGYTIEFDSLIVDKEGMFIVSRDEIP